MYWDVTLETPYGHRYSYVAFTQDGSRPEPHQQPRTLISAKPCRRKPYAATAEGWKHHQALVADMRNRLDRFFTQAVE